jgi:hypothetical protein
LKRAIAALSAAVVALSFAIVANDDLPTGRSTTNQALTAERTADLEAQVRALQSAKAALEAENAAERARIAELAAQVADLRAQLGAPANGCDVTVTSGLQAALDNSPEGATLCLSGTFTTSRPIQPKDGQTLVGPAKIVGQGMTVDGDVFSLKTQDTGSENVTLRDLDISGAGRHGVGCYIGTHIMGGRLHGNGKDGMGCDLDGRSDVGILVDGVEIDHNGTDPVWVLNAAGIKWFHLDGATVQNSHVHDNVGDGVWCDAQCGDFDVLDSVIERNTRKGVFYEKGGESDGTIGTPSGTYTGTMRVIGNVIINNDLDNVPQAHAGVGIYSAKNVLVEGNTFGGNVRAVAVNETDSRLNDDKHGWLVSNVTIRNNTLNGDVVVGCAPEYPVTCSGNV